MHQDLQTLLEKLIKFRDELDWSQFQTPKDLAVSISLEAAELLEHFQWTTEDKDIPPDKRNNMAEEVADILIYLLLFAHKLGIDPVEAAYDKISKNDCCYSLLPGRHQLPWMQSIGKGFDIFVYFGW